MNARRLFLVAAVLAVFVFATLAQAQESDFSWDDTQGGLVDSRTRIVWAGVNLLDITYPYNWDGAMTVAPIDYAASPWGYGFNDWRLPTKEEFLDALSRGMYPAICDASAIVGFPCPEGRVNVGIYWTSSRKNRNARDCWAVTDLETGGRTLLVSKRSGCYVLLVRDR